MSKHIREEAKLADNSEDMLWIFLPNGDKAFRVVDARVKYHAYGKTKSDIEKVQDSGSSGEDSASTAENLSERQFKSGGYKVEVELKVYTDEGKPKTNRTLIAAYEMPAAHGKGVTLSTVTVEFTGPAHGMAPRVSKASAALEIDFTTKGFIHVKGSGKLPYPIIGDRPLVANVDVAFVGVSPTGGEVNFTDATLFIYPNAAAGGVYGTLRAVAAPRALSMDLRLTDNGVESAGMWSVWNRSSARSITKSAAFGYEDEVAISEKNMTTGDLIVYTPASSPAADGSPNFEVNLAYVKNKAEGGAWASRTLDSFTGPLAQLLIVYQCTGTPVHTCRNLLLAWPIDPPLQVTLTVCSWCTSALVHTRRILLHCLTTRFLFNSTSAVWSLKPRHCWQLSHRHTSKMPDLSRKGSEYIPMAYLEDAQVELEK